MRDAILGLGTARLRARRQWIAPIAWLLAVSSTAVGLTVTPVSGLSAERSVRGTAGPSLPPPPRAGAGMAYDAARGQVVLFGGSGDGYRNYGDTWTWDGASWSQRHPATSPAACSYTGMAYDGARREVVLFGGKGCETGACDDTWTWDGTTWTERHPSIAPQARAWMIMAYDAARRQVVMFGGSPGSQVFDDTWTWDGATWTKQRPPASPPARTEAAMAYDAAHRRMVLFGELDSDHLPRLADTWTWDGSTWTRQDPPYAPRERYLHAMAFDALRRQVVLFGGLDLRGDFSDTWTWNGSAWRKHQAPSSPSARHAAGIAYDAARRNVVVFGGCQNQCQSGLNDTWTWDGSTWTDQDATPTPPARTGAAMAYDQARQQLVMFGGCCGGITGELNDTWTWDGQAWTEQHPSVTPDSQAGAAMAYDEAHQVVVLFGTRAEKQPRTWTWDGANWTLWSPPASPSARSNAGIVYDEAGGEAVLFGGDTYDSGCECEVSLRDMWTWDGTNWTRQVPATLPDSRTDMGIAYDAAREEIVIFGGQEGSGGIYRTLGDTWTWNGSTWTKQHPVSSPPAQFRLEMANDLARGEVVLFGADGTTWTWDGTNWSQEYPPVSPPTRDDATMADDEARQRVVLFGGEGDGGRLNDTWTLDGTTWERVG